MRIFNIFEENYKNKGLKREKNILRNLLLIFNLILYESEYM